MKKPKSTTKQKFKAKPRPFAHWKSDRVEKTSQSSFYSPEADSYYGALGCLGWDVSGQVWTLAFYTGPRGSIHVGYMNSANTRQLAVAWATFILTGELPEEATKA